MSVSMTAAAAFDPQDIARRFVAARLAAVALPAFPGTLPADLAAGYLCQDEAIKLWPDRIAGWKVGRIPPELQAELGADRVVGPVFSRNVSAASDRPTLLEAIAGGFAAVEAEYIYRIGRDAPADKVAWTAEEALDFVDIQLVGVEFAGSPLASINALGPRVVAADFGNNAALLLGPPVTNWRERPQDTPPCAVFMDGVLVGEGSPASIPGGPPASLAFLMGICAARGYPLTRGQLVTTGAASGIHDIEAGQTARITFGDMGELACVATLARPGGLGGLQDDGHAKGP